MLQGRRIRLKAYLSQLHLMSTRQHHAPHQAQIRLTCWPTYQVQGSAGATHHCMCQDCKQLHIMYTGAADHSMVDCELKMRAMCQHHPLLAVLSHYRRAWVCPASAHAAPHKHAASSLAAQQASFHTHTHTPDTTGQLSSLQLLLLAAAYTSSAAQHMHVTGITCCHLPRPASSAATCCSHMLSQISTRPCCGMPPHQPTISITTTIPPAGCDQLHHVLPWLPHAQQPCHCHQSTPSHCARSITAAAAYQASSLAHLYHGGLAADCATHHSLHWRTSAPATAA